MNNREQLQASQDSRRDAPTAPLSPLVICEIHVLFKHWNAVHFKKLRLVFELKMMLSELKGKSAQELLQETYDGSSSCAILSTHLQPGGMSSRRTLSLSATSHMSQMLSPNVTEQTSDITLFLQVEDEVKKVSLHGEKSFTAIWQLFQSRFFVDDLLGVARIYIQNKQSSVWYELEDLGDLENNCILKLYLKKPSASLSVMDDTETIRPVLISVSEQLDALSGMVQTLCDQSSRINTTDTPAPLDPAHIHTPCENCLVQRNSLQLAQSELTVLRKTYQDYRKTTAQRVEALQSTSSLLEALQLCIPTASLRQKSAPLSQQLASMHTSLTTRFPELNIMIDDMRRDVTEYHSRPSDAHIDHVRRHFPALRRTLQEFEQHLAFYRSDMKKVWEKELQTIVYEQNQVQSWDASLMALTKDLQSMDDAIKALEQIDEMFAEKMVAKEINLEVVESIDDSTKNRVLEELVMAATSADANARLLALEQAELRRKRDIQLRLEAPVGEFGRELDSFVSNKQFKNSGLLGILEKERAERDRQALEAIVLSRCHDNEQNRSPSEPLSSLS